MIRRAIVSAILAALATLSSVGASAQTHTLVSVGDHRLDVVKGGSGRPAIIFETGLADSLDTWLPTWRTMMQSTTAIDYSRAGFGRSESGSSDHSVRAEAADLHALLHALAVAPPLILVARSYGSLISRLYTSLYPNEVAGLVLVDGTHEQQVKRFGEIDSTYPRAFRVYFDSVIATLPPGPAAAETRETVRIQAAGTVAGLEPLPDIPIAVLTSMKSDESAPYVNGTARGHEVWRALHDEWFQRSRNGVHIETTHSGHDIQDDEPALVEMAIRFVVDRVRADAASAQSAVPLEREAKHHLVLANGYVRVFDVSVPAGDSTLYHVHANDYVYVTFGAAALRAQALGAAPTPLSLGDGEVRFTRGPITHRVMNPSTVAFHNLTIEVLKPVGATRVSLAPAAGQPVLENDRVRVERVVLAPGVSTGRHELLGPWLDVVVRSGAARVEEESGATRRLNLARGQYVWHRDSTARTITNVGSDTLELIQIEWKSRATDRRSAPTHVDYRTRHATSDE
ncbi:MAG: alpha/beta fold hydrolase [Gemmatimonadales bacterium]